MPFGRGGSNESRRDWEETDQEFGGFVTETVFGWDSKEFQVEVDSLFLAAEGQVVHGSDAGLGQVEECSGCPSLDQASGPSRRTRERSQAALGPIAWTCC